MFFSTGVKSVVFLVTSVKSVVLFLDPSENGSSALIKNALPLPYFGLNGCALPNLAII